MTGTVKGYEFFEHTADIGIRARGESLAALCVHLAQGLTALIAEDSALEPRTARPIHVVAADAESLVLVWLQELLFWFSTDRFLPAQYALEEVTETSLRGVLHGETFDPARHAQGREVKAITRHLLKVERRRGGWQGEVLVDI